MNRLIFAKLKSEIKDDGKEINVEVYDDELQTKQSVMWLHSSLLNESDAQVFGKIPGIHVNIVDFADDLFFNLDQKRQDACATVLFKAFLKHYQEHYGKNSKNWQPVIANFANYPLQEKFTEAVNKGIFPPESLSNSEFIDEDIWKDDPSYNMDNRKLANELQKNMQTYMPNCQIEDTFVVNTPYNTTKNDLIELKNEYPIVANDVDGDPRLYGYYDGGKLYWGITFFGGAKNGAESKFQVNIDDDTLELYFELDSFKELAKNPNFDRSLLNGINNVLTSFDEDEEGAIMSLDEFFKKYEKEDQETQVASNRLRRLKSGRESNRG